MTNEELAQFNSHASKVREDNNDGVVIMTNEQVNMFNAHINNHIDKSKDLPSELKILGWGVNESTKGPVILSDKSVRVLELNQKTTGFEEVPLDFEHNSISGSPHWTPGAQDIAAYGTPDLVPGKGLYLKNLKWTPIGKEKARNYIDLSPAVKTDNEGNVVWVDSCALTTNGSVYNLHTFSADGSEERKTNMKKLAEEVPGYNEKGANAGLKETGGNKFEVSKATSIDDKEALHKIGELEDHEKGEIAHDETNPECECAQCMSAKDLKSNFQGSDENWTEKEHKAHKDLVKELSEDDHYSKYGDVKYADEKSHKYPIDTAKHIRAAWSYINHPKNAKKEGGRLTEVKGKIQSAMKKIGADVETNSAVINTKKLSADGITGIPVPKAYKNQPWYYQKSMNTQIKRFSTEDASSYISG